MNTVMHVVSINEEPVELYKILKFEGIAASGGQAKQLIELGDVLVNSIVETRKRRKMRAGDVISVHGQCYKLELAQGADTN